MKIRFTRNVTVDVETKHGEFHDRAYSHWQEIRVDSVFPHGNFATIKLDNGDVLHGVPVSSFEQVKEEKRAFSL